MRLSKLRWVALLVALVWPLLVPLAVSASYDPFKGQGTNPGDKTNNLNVCSTSGGSSAVCNTSGADPVTGQNGAIAKIINILSIVVGIVSVIFMVIGGFKYITSNGDSSAVASAKSTIIYALVGLVVAALAQSIIKFVLSRV